MAYCVVCGEDLAGREACCEQRAYDPPRYCPRCGSWLVVRIAPTGHVANCPEHGRLEQS